jgi:hypothetical protein
MSNFINSLRSSFSRQTPEEASEQADGFVVVADATLAEGGKFEMKLYTSR